MKFFVTSKISDNIYKTPEGFLVCVGVPVARTGVQIYGEGETPLETLDGEIEIFRDEAEVFRPETIASFAGKAITISHPVDFVTPENWSVLSKGVLQNPRRGEGDLADDLLADLLITEKTAIKLVESGLREVSCGYEADYEQTGPGKGIQKNIIGNHLALVDQGRAGSRYAIQDHKGEKKMTFKERIKAIFAKAQDEAMKVADEAKEDKKDDKAKDEDKKDDKAKDESAYDAMEKKVADLEMQIKALSGDGDEDKDDKTSDDDEKESELLSRIKALETAVSQLKGSKDEDKKDDEDKTDDDDGDDDEDDKSTGDEDSMDADKEDSKMVGDTASRAEILAPGINYKAKDVKKKALKAAYDTKEGKKVIDGLTGGNPTFDSAEKIDVLFVAASEVLKQKRQEELARTKRTKDGNENGNADEGAMTPEKLNEINRQHYKQA